MTISIDPQSPSGVQDVRDARDRYVSAAETAPPLVVVGAAGARIEADGGRSYIDFAGGIGCQNLGHGAPGVVRAIHEQVDRYLHQCFMVGRYRARRTGKFAYFCTIHIGQTGVLVVAKSPG